MKRCVIIGGADIGKHDWATERRQGDWILLAAAYQFEEKMNKVRGIPFISDLFVV